MPSFDKFEKNPINISINRSRFTRANTRKTTCKSGELVPFYLDEVLPGDTFKIDLKALTKMISPAVPVMDNARADIRFFFVPSRLCCIHEKDWAKIMGENVNSYGIPVSEATLINTGNTINIHDLDTEEIDGVEYYISPGSILNQLGLPIYKGSGSIDYEISLLPVKAYGLIWNEFYRDENLQAPLDLNSSSFYNGCGLPDCLYSNKLRDLFTSCLPYPQKSANVVLPIGDLAPVIPGDEFSKSFQETIVDNAKNVKLREMNVSGTGADMPTDGVIGMDNGEMYQFATSGTAVEPVFFSNLYADLSNATGTTINELRNAFALQRLFEKDARGGTRYREIILSHFNVKVPDSTVQVPEYLGGMTFDINIDTVLQTSETTSNGHLGEYGAYSNSFGSKNKIVEKSFTEFGYIMGLLTIRVENSYSQGVSKLWTRNRRYDFYDPVFAHLGEMPVYKDELFINANSTPRGSVFGYQEAWAEYRFKPNEVTGYFAYGSGDSLLPLWTYQTNFISEPSLTNQFVQENSNNLNKTLVDSNVNYSFICEFYIKNTCTRPMPINSIPGLIDHD